MEQYRITAVTGQEAETQIEDKTGMIGVLTNLLEHLKDDSIKVPPGYTLIIMKIED